MVSYVDDDMHFIYLYTCNIHSTENLSENSSHHLLNIIQASPNM